MDPAGEQEMCCLWQISDFCFAKQLLLYVSQNIIQRQVAKPSGGNTVMQDA